MPNRDEFRPEDLLAVLDALATGCVIYDGEHRAIFANKAAREAWPVLYEWLDAGGARRDGVERQIRAMYPDAPDEKIMTMTEAAYNATIGNVDLDIATATGRIMRTEHFSFGDGFSLGISIDVTELRARERELAKALNAAAAANEAKSDFIAKLSHEIRTPMNGVLGLVELLSRTPLSQTQATYVDTIRTSSHALLGVVEEVLDLSKIEAGFIDLRLAPFCPKNLVEEVVALLRPNAHASGLTLDMRIEGGAMATLVGDYGKFRQVLTNLVGNALKFTKEGGVVVEVGLAEANDGRYRLRFAVEDTGPGIAAEDLSKIFDRYHRNKNTANEAGAGLGLTIVKALIEAMDGDINVSSAPGRGARFTVETMLRASPEALKSDAAGRRVA